MSYNFSYIQIVDSIFAIEHLMSFLFLGPNSIASVPISSSLYHFFCNLKRKVQINNEERHYFEAVNIAA